MEPQSGQNTWLMYSTIMIQWSDGTTKRSKYIVTYYNRYGWPPMKSSQIGLCLGTTFCFIPSTIQWHTDNSSTVDSITCLFEYIGWINNTLYSYFCTHIHISGGIFTSQNHSKCEFHLHCWLCWLVNCKYMYLPHNIDRSRFD